MLDTPGGLRPTGGGKTGGLGCGSFLVTVRNVKINKKTQQFIRGDFLQFHWMSSKMRLVWRALEPSPRDRKDTDCQRIGWQKTEKLEGQVFL